MSYPLPVWTDGDFHTATPVGLPEFSSPIAGIATEYVLKQKFWQFRNNFAPGALDGTLTHPDYPTFLLVEESPREDLGSGVVQWQRTYAKVPDTYYDWTNKNYSFIGLSNSTSISSGAFIPNRTRQARTVACRQQYDYVLCPQNGHGLLWVDPIWGPYIVNNPEDLKKVWAMQYCQQVTISTGAILGGISYPLDALNDAGSDSATTPTLQQYWQTILPDSYTNGWNGTKTKQVILPDYTITGGIPPTGGHFAGSIDTASTVYGGIIPAEDSVINRFMGNIYCRISHWILAQ